MPAAYLGFESGTVMFSLWKFSHRFPSIWSKYWLKKTFKSTRPEVFCKKVFLEISQNSQENNCAQVSFCRCNFIKKEALAQVFCCEFCEISQNTFSYRTAPVAASDHSKEFSRNVVAPVYDALKNFLLLQKAIFHLVKSKQNVCQASKKTGIDLMIWDINNSQINRDIYARHSALGYGSGESITNHLLNKLETLCSLFLHSGKYILECT